MTTAEAERAQVEAPDGEAPSSGDIAFGPDAPLFEIMATTRAMRRLRSDPVPDELVDQLVQAAIWGPSGRLVEGLRLVVVRDRRRITELAGVWRHVIASYRRAAGEGQRIASDPVMARMAANIDYQADHFTEIPVVIVACYDDRANLRAARRRYRTHLANLRAAGPRRAVGLLRGFGPFRDRSEAACVYPALQNLLLAARALGLGATLTTWHLLAEGEVRAILGIPNDVRTYAIIPIGWPVGRFGPVVRRAAIDDIVRKDRW
jgi:nitroreductase